MSYSILGPVVEGGRKLPLCLFQAPAGFPSPAADHIEAQISLDEVLNIRAPHVYLVSIIGDSMEGAGIFDGDLAVVDRSLEPARLLDTVVLTPSRPPPELTGYRTASPARLIANNHVAGHRLPREKHKHSTARVRQ